MLALWVERKLEGRKETRLRVSKSWQAGFQRKLLLELNLGLNCLCKGARCHAGRGPQNLVDFFFQERWTMRVQICTFWVTDH